MAYYVLKVAITAALVVLISEIAKRSALAGAVLASVPLVSVLAMIWLYVDTRDSAQVAELARSVFWLVLPSLVLFIVLPVLLMRGQPFWFSLAIAVAATIAAYFGTVWMLRFFGIEA